MVANKRILGVREGDNRGMFRRLEQKKGEKARSRGEGNRFPLKQVKMGGLYNKSQGGTGRGPQQIRNRTQY